MHAEIAWLGTLDDVDLETWRPQTEDWAMHIRLVAGPEGSPAQESFDLTVCSVEWVRRLVARDSIVDGRHMLIVESFDWKRLRHYIERRVSALEADDWDSLAEKLSRLGGWEFEDYRE